MAATVRCDVDQVGRHLLVRLTGELTVSTAAAIRRQLLKCLADQPDSLLVDLTGMATVQPIALSVFAAVARQAAMWPGTPVLVCGADRVIEAKLVGGGYGRVPVFGSVDQALAAGPRRRVPSIEETLLPVSGAARRARDVVTEACTRWDLPQLAGAACIVASELVANGQVHAHTMMRLRLSLRRRYLMISVRDGSPAEPRLVANVDPTKQGGRGLMIVDALTRRWGSIATDDGKVVWAVLDTCAAGSD